MIYLDTNVIGWLAAAPDQLSNTAQNRIREAVQLLVSPMVELEVEYLHEIGRLRLSSRDVFAHVRTALEIRVCGKPFHAVVEMAKRLRWTRDPFDRLIVAQAALDDQPLVTRDKAVLANYRSAVW